MEKTKKDIIKTELTYIVCDIVDWINLVWIETVAGYCE